MPLENLDDLEAEWAIFIEPKNTQGKNTQDENWRRDNPGEWQKLQDYRNDRSKRPTLSTSTGRRMVEHLDAWWEAKGVVTPPPPPGEGLPFMLKHWNGGDRREASSWPGFIPVKWTLSNNSPADLNLESGKDYFVDMSSISWSSYPFPDVSDARTNLIVRGGRHFVFVGGEFLFNSTNKNDDCGGLRFVGGDPGGVAYCEGIRGTSVNGSTINGVKKIIFNHCHFKARSWNDDHSGGNHPDIVQVWNNTQGQAEIYMYRFTGYTWYTGLVQLLEQAKRWKRHKVDLHFGTRVGQSQQMGNYMLYLSPGNEQITTLYDGGDDNWMDLGWWGGRREQLQMAIDSPGWTTWKIGYEIWRNGVKIGASNNPNQYQGADAHIGATQGDQWRCTSNANVKERWNWGKNPNYPNGEHATWDDCGPDYEPLPVAANALLLG